MSIDGRTGRLNQSQREELALIEQAYDNPHECESSSYNVLSYPKARDCKVCRESSVYSLLSVPSKSPESSFSIHMTN